MLLDKLLISMNFGISYHHSVCVKQIKEHNYQVNANAVAKVIQLYETKNSRHSVMLVGKTQSGKTVMWQTLKHTLTRLKQENEPGYESVQEYTINPKSVTLGKFQLINNLMFKINN